eukprot:c21984_g2_i1 orf=175-1035(+)
MEDQEDYYGILGLQEGTEASSEVIRKAYRSKALLCHPDKRPDDPLAAAEFQQLQKAYDILSDEKARKAYDELLNVRKARLEKESKVDSKRRKMMEDLKRRENLFEARTKEKEDEENAVKRFQTEITRIRAMRGQRGVNFDPLKPERPEEPGKEQEQERMLKVSWKPAKNGGIDYSAVMIKDIFQQYGRVEDIVILQKKDTGKQSSALVVMNSRDEVLAAIRQPHGRLFVEPLVPHSGSSFANTFTSGSTAPVSSGENLVGNAFHDHEDSILKKMRKKAEQLKSSAT